MVLPRDLQTELITLHLVQGRLSAGLGKEKLPKKDVPVERQGGTVVVRLHRIKQFNRSLR